MKNRTGRIVLTVAVALLSAGLAGCGGPPPTETPPAKMSILVDMGKTTDWANSRGYQYCNINSDRVCQSPDSVLDFQFPKEIKDTSFDDQVQADLVIWNRGTDEIRLSNYSITAFDDSSQTYLAVLAQPEEFGAAESYLTADQTKMTLQADERIRLPFTVSLDDSFRTITRLAFRYQTGQYTEPTEIAISYRPSSILGEDRR